MFDCEVGPSPLDHFKMATFLNSRKVGKLYERTFFFKKTCTILNFSSEYQPLNFRAHCVGIDNEKTCTKYQKKNKTLC